MKKKTKKPVSKSAPRRFTGEIDYFSYSKGSGYIKGKNGKCYHFYSSEVKGSYLPEEGQYATFEVVNHYAVNIELRAPVSSGGFSYLRDGY